ncbi:hypothetical protein GGR50DRAFT_672979 [Xylaria sp. CBS 124048]|nr:hypothetical protein GGR50DRAFT_672979 [Xylaria sp. CBS 124048]
MDNLNIHTERETFVCMSQNPLFFLFFLSNCSCGGWYYASHSILSDMRNIFQSSSAEISLRISITLYCLFFFFFFFFF